MKWDLLDLLPDPTVISEYETGNYVFVNQEFVKQSGFEKDLIAGLSSVDIYLMSAQERTKVIQALEQNNGHITNLEIVCNTTSGGRYFAGLSCRVFENDGKKLIITTVRNMSDFRIAKETKDDMKVLVKQMEHLSAGIEECASMSDFLANQINHVITMGGVNNSGGNSNQNP